VGKQSEKPSPEKIDRLTRNFFEFTKELNRSSDAIREPLLDRSNNTSFSNLPALSKKLPMYSTLSKSNLHQQARQDNPRLRDFKSYQNILQRHMGERAHQGAKQGKQLTKASSFIA
jgi:hypothetical protein